MKMRQRLISILLVGCFVIAHKAQATPIMIDRSQAAGEARRDSGSGLCGSTTKFVNQPLPLASIAEAQALLDKPANDPNVYARVSRIVQSVNYSVGAGSEADFTAPSFADDYFPYCQDPMAMPAGADDNNIAMRLRGYLNITNTRGGQPITFAIKCDDGCALWLGKNRQLITQANDDSPSLTGRRARWISFRDPGLYPVELVYFQNASSGYFEWSRALSAVFASDDLAVDDVQWGQEAASFAPLSKADLFSAMIGSNTACTECDATGTSCTAGSYCSDGLCQSCNVPDHCGSSCQTCPADRRVCSAGKCVQCLSDAWCSPGSFCNISTGNCASPWDICSSHLQCAVSSYCLNGFCMPEPVPCKHDGECLAGQICICEDYSTSCTQKLCVAPPHICASTPDCPMNYYCDETASICKPMARYKYEGGAPGCGISATASHLGLPCLAFMCVALLGARRRRARQ